MSSASKLFIYTDGAGSGNPGVGGYGAILLYGSHSREIYGGRPLTTNNQMELIAVIEALYLYNSDKIPLVFLIDIM